MRVLITGAAGFIGSNFTRYLSEQHPGYEITAVDSLTYAGDKSRLDGLDVRFVQADINDNAQLEPLIEGIDWVVHFAAETHVDKSIDDPGPFLHANVLGTDNLARLALKHQVKRFHHVSTDEVFGSLKLDSAERFNEQTPYGPRSPYAASKAASDHIVRAYGETYGLPYTITNCSNNYGPFDSPNRIISLFITNAMQNKPLPLYGDGKSVRDYLFVTDHCRAIELALSQGEIGQTYCIGGGSERNGIQVAEAILDALGKPRDLIQFVVDRPGHDRRYSIDPGFASRVLGWKPKVDFKAGLAQTIDWYKQNQTWWQAWNKRPGLAAWRKGVAK